MRAAIECFEQTRADRLMRRVREIRKAGGAALEVHHEAVGEVHAVAFRRHIGSALKVREGNAGHFGEPPDLLEEREPPRRRDVGAKPAEHHVPHSTGWAAHRQSPQPRGAMTRRMRATASAGSRSKRA